MMLYYQAPINSTILFLPILIILQIMLALGMGLILSALNVSYRDIRFIVPVALQLWLYLTPVIYPVSMVPERYLPFYMLNPMAGIIDGYRQVLLFNTLPDLTALLPSIIISIIMLVGAYAYFKWAETEFADVI
jgi:lipopolysaccharide transport system permease protein